MTDSRKRARNSWADWDEEEIKREFAPWRATEMKTGHVQEISFHVVADGKRTVVEFHRRTKIDDLLRDDGSLGLFLRELVEQALKKS